MLDEIAETQIGDLNNREPVRVRAKSSLKEVVLAIKQGNRGAAIVEDDFGKILGIFTERDLILQIAKDKQNWQDLTIDKVMIRDPQTIEVSHNIREALACMVEGQFRHLPIVDADKHVRGIVSIRDILVHIVSYYPEEFLNLPPDSEHEVSKQWGG